MAFMSGNKRNSRHQHQNRERQSLLHIHGATVTHIDGRRFYKLWQGRFFNLPLQRHAMQLNRQQLRQAIEDSGLVSNYIDLDRQLTPNGIDLTLEQIERFKGKGQLDFSNEERELPETEPVEKDGDWWELEQDIYKVRANEVVDIPLHLVGIGFPRSSLMRMGCHIQNAFWEAGFNGNTECLLCVENPEGVRIKQDARILQLSFHKMEEIGEGYNGQYSF